MTKDKIRAGGWFGGTERSEERKKEREREREREEKGKYFGSCSLVEFVLFGEKRGIEFSTHQ